MNRLLHISVIAIGMFVCCGQAAAAIACRSAPGTDSYYQYRLIDNRKCWFRGHTKLEKSALAWKQNTPGAPGTTRKVPGVEAVAVSAVMTETERSGSYPTERSDSSRPVPFAGEAPGPSTLAVDVRASASESRRGEPAPDFDAVFGHFPAYEVARPGVHLLYPTRVSQAYGARPVATIAYRATP